jgi:signal transduction histidine kinase
MKLLLHTHSVMAFILLLSGAAMFVHLLTLRQAVHAKKWLLGFYFGIVCWQTDNVIRYSVPLEYYGTTVYSLQTVFWLIPTLALTLVSHTQYVYRFLVDAFERERKIALWVGIALSVGELLFVAWNEWYNGSDMELMLQSAFFYGSLFTVWIIILAWRKAVYLRSINRRASKFHFIYAGINGCYVVGSLISLFYGFFSQPGFMSYFLFIWLGNLASIVLYIVSAAVPASFSIKITGFAFVLAATVLTLITLSFYKPALLNDMALRVTQQEGLSKLMVITATVALLISVLMPFMLRVSFTTRLQRLLDGVEQVNAGHLNTQVPVGLPDEIGMLAKNFNRMTQNLRKAQDELTNYAQTLEIKVATRTQQLQASLNELKTAQAQLIQSEKMASLGELTAGIAHEIKNPLNFIINFSEISEDLAQELKEEIEKDVMDKENALDLVDDLSSNFQKITHHGKRASSIVSGMLAHSRKTKGTKELTDINELVETYLQTSYEEMQVKDKSLRVILEKHFDPAVGKLDLVADEMGRVLLNLFNNAFYAVNEKKKALNGSFEPTVSVTTRKAEDKVELCIRDNGTGIAKGDLNKIFQPFFTTKPAGEGTGLGLSLSYGIVKAHGGQLKVETREGEGTAFVIQLPLSDK